MSNFFEQMVRHQNRMDTINETGLMSCNYCGEMVDVSDCSVYPEMIEKVVLTHIRREHPDKCMSNEKFEELMRQERRVDKDEFR